MDSVVGVGAVLRSFHVWHFMYIYAYIRRKRTAAGVPWLLASCVGISVLMYVEYKPFLIKHGGEDGEAMSVCLLTRYSRPL